jgi:hypothetical protein
VIRSSLGWYTPRSIGAKSGRICSGRCSMLQCTAYYEEVSDRRCTFAGTFVDTYTSVDTIHSTPTNSGLNDSSPPCHSVMCSGSQRICHWPSCGPMARSAHFSSLSDTSKACMVWICSRLGTTSRISSFASVSGGASQDAGLHKQLIVSPAPQPTSRIYSRSIMKSERIHNLGGHTYACHTFASYLVEHPTAPL